MAEIKNSFIKSKMNKDLDDRLIPNGEDRNAVNVAINKSTGENVGTAQTVLGNKLIKSIDPLLGKTGLQFIGALPDDTNNIIYAFLTNNILEPYVANGSVGNNQTYPDNQDTSAGGPISITAAGSTYTTEITGETTNITVANPDANGLTVGFLMQRVKPSLQIIGFLLVLFMNLKIQEMLSQLPLQDSRLFCFKIWMGK